MKRMTTKAGTPETVQLVLGEDMANVGQKDPEEDPAKAPNEAAAVVLKENSFPEAKRKAGEKAFQAGVTMMALPSRSKGVTGNK